MSKRVPLAFKKSLIAIAVASLSACAVLPQMPNADSEGIGGNIIKAGQSVANVGLSTWDKTTRFLGFRDANEGLEERSQSNNALLAQQNIDPSAPSSEDGVTLQAASNDQPVLIQSADTPTVGLSLSDTTASNDSSQLVDNDLDTLVLNNTDNSGSEISELASSDTAVPRPNLESSGLTEANRADTNSAAQDTENPSLFALDQPLSSDVALNDDVIHTVGDNETLWQIAKLTTGNANNWHTLADVNDLTQSATVFPGQELVIPANMVKPGYGVIGDTEQAMADNQPAVIAQPQAAPEVQEDLDTMASNTPESLPDTTITLGSNTEAAPEIASAVPASLTITEESNTALPTAISQNAKAIDLNEGETLWDFARRTTGDATNWQAIAAQNNFTEKQAVTVRPGQTIYVPQSLLRTDDISEAKIDELEPVSEATLPRTDDQQTQPATAQLSKVQRPKIQLVGTYDEKQAENVRLSAANAQNIQDLQGTQVAYKSTDALAPSSSVESEKLQVVAQSESIPEEVMVSGTYYPKAVYNNADFSSSLLTRVSPGTTLQVSRLMGSWFEVETDKGVGYVHQRDIQ